MVFDFLARDPTRFHKEREIERGTVVKNPRAVVSQLRSAKLVESVRDTRADPLCQHEMRHRLPRN